MGADDSSMNIDEDTNYTLDDVASEIDAVDISNSEVEEIIYFFDETDCQDEEIVNSSIFAYMPQQWCVWCCGCIFTFFSTASFVGDW